MKGINFLFAKASSFHVLVVDPSSSPVILKFSRLPVSREQPGFAEGCNYISKKKNTKGGFLTMAGNNEIEILHQVNIVPDEDDKKDVKR